MSRPESNLLLSLAHLEVLDAIERQGSFSSAAKTLNRATSAVSYAVKGLEDALEVKIFDRSGHRAKLTEAGRLILDEGRSLLTEARRLERIALRLKQSWEARLTIVIDGVLPMAPVMRALRRFARKELPTTVEMHVEYLSRVRERFEHENMDLMLTIDQGPDAGLVVEPMMRLEMLLLAHREHPLAHRKTVTRRDFRNHIELLVSPEAGRHMAHISKMYLGGGHICRLSDFNSKRSAMLEQVGFGWMPRHLVEEDLASGSLEVLPYSREKGRAWFTPQLIHRASPQIGRSAELFRALLLEELNFTACSENLNEKA